MAEHVFLCHSAGDKEQVRSLYRRLQEDGIRPWLDGEDILPGQDWENEIRRAIRKSRYVLVCLSESSVTTSGYVHKEIKQALDIADKQPEGSIFLIPVRLEPCQLPDRLGTWQWVDLFVPGAYERLLLSLKREQTSGTFEEEPRFSRRQPVPGNRYDSRSPPPRETFRDPIDRITSVIESIVRIAVPLAVVAGLLVAGVEFGPRIVEKFQGIVEKFQGGAASTSTTPLGRPRGSSRDKDIDTR